nr:hypothetical protein CFP56_21228 [Quercus suber]
MAVAKAIVSTTSFLECIADISDHEAACEARYDPPTRLCDDRTTLYGHRPRLLRYGRDAKRRVVCAIAKDVLVYNNSLSETLMHRIEYDLCRDGWADHSVEVFRIGRCHRIPPSLPACAMLRSPEDVGESCVAGGGV